MGIEPTTNVDLAMDALELAAQTAERGQAPSAWLRAGIADYRAAAAKDAMAVRGRLDRVVMGQDPEIGLDALLATGALDALFPEVHAMVGFGDGEWRHKDVWKHTKQVVRQAVPRLEVRWAALFHDIGKVKTRSISPDGKVHFLGHAEVGTRMFDKLERRMPLFSPEPALKDTVRFSSCTTCARTSTKLRGRTAPSAASRASSARTSPICSASRARTSRRSGRRRSGAACRRSKSSPRASARSPRRTRRCRRFRAGSGTRS